VGAGRDPIAHIVGEQRQPVTEPPVVEEAGFAVEELLDLAGEVLVTHSWPPAPRRSVIRPSPWPRSAGPSAGRTGGGCSRSCDTRWPSRRAPARSARARAPSA